jgi:hypothetical protein
MGWIFSNYREALSFRFKMAVNILLGYLIPKYRRAKRRNKLALELAKLCAKNPDKYIFM